MEHWLTTPAGREYVISVVPPVNGVITYTWTSVNAAAVAIAVGAGIGLPVRRGPYCRCRRDGGLLMVDRWAMPLGVAYRDWLLDLAKQEADAGCPRLLAMKSEDALYFADLTDTWEAERRYNRMCARIKWLCTNNYGYPPVPVTEQETAASARWNPPRPGRAPLLRTPGPWGAVGVEIVRAADREKQERCGVMISTTLDFGVRFGQFAYLQVLHTPDFDRLLRHGGILTLLGAPQTRWGRLTNADIPATAELLVRLCREFVDAVPKIWARSGLADKPLPER